MTLALFLSVLSRLRLLLYCCRATFYLWFSLHISAATTVTGTFNNGDSCGTTPRQSIIAMTCDPTAIIPKLVSVRENPTCVYNAQISSSVNSVFVWWQLIIRTLLVSNNSSHVHRLSAISARAPLPGPWATSSASRTIFSPWSLLLWALLISHHTCSAACP